MGKEYKKIQKMIASKGKESYTMNILPLFPTPIGSIHNFITEKERLKLFKDIKNTVHFPHGSIKGDGYSTHEKPDYCIDKNIVERIHDVANKYSEQYGNEPLRLEKVWSNIQNSGSILTEHCHPNSIVSGALYINVSDDDKLWFHNPNPYITFMHKHIETPYNFDSYWIPVKNCELVLFPSWLKHGKYDEVIKIDDRIVVSFNLSI